MVNQERRILEKTLEKQILMKKSNKNNFINKIKLLSR
jgi:hypothetical protein